MFFISNLYVCKLYLLLKPYAHTHTHAVRVSHKCNVTLHYILWSGSRGIITTYAPTPTYGYNIQLGFGFVAFKSEETVEKICKTQYHTICSKTVCWPIHSFPNPCSCVYHVQYVSMSVVFSVFLCVSGCHGCRLSSVPDFTCMTLL